LPFFQCGHHQIAGNSGAANQLDNNVYIRIFATSKYPVKHSGMMYRNWGYLDERQLRNNNFAV